MARRWTRRQFLRWAGMLTAGVTLIGPGCAGGATSPQARPEVAPPADGETYLAVARGSDVAAVTRKAIAALGGMSRFVTSGDDVIIKPNICVDYNPPEYAATTHPTVVATLVKLCLEAGAERVRVMDTPFGGTAESAYAISGIEAATIEAGGRMELMNRAKFVNASISEGRSLRSVSIYRDLLTADVVINVPIAKHHSLARLSLGMKNLLGVVASPNQLHSDIGQNVADLASLVRPTLTVVDAIRILVAHGPTGGSLNDVVQADTVIAGQDFVSADAWAATLFGLQGTDVPYIRAAADMALGVADLDTIQIDEFDV